jgi:hypothetical protein
MQAKLVAAIAVLHNFIRINDPDDGNSLDCFRGGAEQREAHQGGGIGDDEDDEDDFRGVITPAEQRRAKERRDRIAKQMWEDYTMYLNQNTE